MSETPVPGPREFTTTHWSLVEAAQSDEASRTQARTALAELCRAYWYPLYAFVRHRGYSSFDAQDLTQSFFVEFIEANGFASADRERGRFRTYLLGAMKHFLAKEWRRARMQKRGGGRIFLEWDALAPEARYALEPAQSGDPHLAYDKAWALELVARAKENLLAESEANGKGKLFEALRQSLTGDEPSRKETAELLGLSEGALKAAVHRLRQRYRELLRAEIAETVNTRMEIDDEMRYLVAVLRGR
jgi:RNA polymerase sigma factor (sigma-70 family)